MRKYEDQTPLYDVSHLAILDKGVDEWNAWRRDNPNIRPQLVGANLHGANLAGFDLSGANISDWHHSTNLRDATLTGANLQNAEIQSAVLLEANLDDVNAEGAVLRRATLRNASCRNANFRRAHLQESELTGTHFEGADFTEAWLARAAIYDTYFAGAKLVDCYVAGVSAWDVHMDGAIQSGLNISRSFSDEENEEKPGESITVDDIEVANFVHMVKENAKLQNLLNAGSAKAVLILGRFTPPDRKAVLDELRIKLRAHDLVPMIFDFDRPDDKDYTETVQAMASISRFVVVDLTQPKSTPLEVQALGINFKVPMVPIFDVTKDKFPFAMFENLQIFPWVLPVLEYQGKDDLIDVLKAAIVDRANQTHEMLSQQKARGLRMISTEAFRTKNVPPPPAGES
ncbi:MAG: pentapeptide repeat-containing protein [bacterium]|nr:pentapeptide repeat-containing protein [bacterium]